MSMKTQNIIRQLNNVEDKFDFSNLDENHKLFSKKNKKVLRKFKKETPKNVFLDEFICLRSKMYGFECGNESKNKIKGISESYSKIIKFEEYKKCLDGKIYQEESDNYILGSISHEMYLQKIQKILIICFR